MTIEEDNCKMDENCSKGTCAPVSPFSKEGILFLIFVVILLVLVLILIS